ncbi:MAG: hypothetical protein KDA05_11335, partial [Phycisphaerales bacterium]|nr:hypothetical protein [Phycisphaerales bacterium]
MRTADARQSGGFGLEPEQTTGANPLMLVHRLLRGRYAWAIALSVVLGAPLAWLGYRSKTPMFTSEAIVRIAPTQSPILFQTEQNEAIPYFDQYVSSQAARMSSEETLRMALAREGMETAGWEGGNIGLVALRRSVSVQAPARAGMLRLTVSHPTPNAAQVACRSILSVYMDFYDQDSRNVFSEQKRALEDRIALREAERGRALQSVQDIATRRGTEQLQPRIDSLSREVADLDIRLAQIRAALTVRGVAVDSGATEPSTSSEATRSPGTDQPEGSVQASPPDWTPETVPVDVLAQGDAELADLLRVRQRLVAEIEVFTSQFSPRHLEVRTRQSELERTERLIEQRVAFLRGRWGQGPDLAAATTDDLRLQFRQAMEQRDELFASLSELAGDQRRLQDARDRAARAEADRLEAA